VNQFQSALNDAQKCINLASGWAKGYGRKAAALVGLGRVAQAVDCYRQGLAIEPDNATLIAGLEGLVGPAKPADDAAAAGLDGSEAEGAAGATVKIEGDLAAAAAAPAAAAAAAAATAKAAAPKPAPPPMDEADLELLSEFLSEATDIERKQHAERILKYHLNPYEVRRGLRCGSRRGLRQGVVGAAWPKSWPGRGESHERYGRYGGGDGLGAAAAMVVRP
jgi:tetratricopeptide (TPR) repeat protein